MPITVPPPPPAIHASRDETWQHWHGDILWTDRLLYVDATRQFVSEFQVGDVRYRPLEGLQAYYEPPTMRVPGRFVVTGLQEHFIGRGKTLEEARSDWEQQIDFAIQHLLGTEDFERTEQDERKLETLGRYFDLTEIRYGTPLIQRSQGQLVSAYPRPWKVRWVDGTTNSLSREQLPAQMVSLGVGQTFDAVVERDPRTWKLIRIVSAFRTRSLPAMTQEDTQALLDSIPKSTDQRQLEWQ